MQNEYSCNNLNLTMLLLKWLSLKDRLEQKGYCPILLVYIQIVMLYLTFLSIFYFANVGMLVFIFIVFLAYYSIFKVGKIMQMMENLIERMNRMCQSKHMENCFFYKNSRAYWGLWKMFIFGVPILIVGVAIISTSESEKLPVWARDYTALLIGIITSITISFLFYINTTLRDYLKKDYVALSVIDNIAKSWVRFEHIERLVRRCPYSVNGSLSLNESGNNAFKCTNNLCKLNKINGICQNKRWIISQQRFLKNIVTGSQNTMSVVKPELAIWFEMMSHDINLIEYCLEQNVIAPTTIVGVKMAHYSILLKNMDAISSECKVNFDDRRELRRKYVRKLRNFRRNINQSDLGGPPL